MAYKNKILIEDRAFTFYVNSMDGKYKKNLLNRCAQSGSTSTILPSNLPKNIADLSKGHTPELNQRTLDACRITCREILKRNRTPHSVHDYPAATVTCALAINGTTVTKNSGCSTVSWYNNNLKKKISSLLKLGDMGLTKTCGVGRCAEPHAANAVLKHVKDRNRIISNLLFSGAFRPRTKEFIDYCDNCKETFDNLK